MTKTIFQIYCVAFIFVFFLVLLQPFGFDIYYHLFYLQSSELDFFYNRPNHLFGLKINRYILFSEIVDLFPLPTIITISMLTSISWCVVFAKFVLERKFNQTVAIIISFYFLLFWTPVTISVGMLLSAFLLIRKRKSISYLYMFFSVFFHPVSFVLLFMMLLFLGIRSDWKTALSNFLFGLVSIFIALSFSNYYSEANHTKYHDLSELHANVFLENKKELLVLCDGTTHKNTYATKYCYKGEGSLKEKGEGSLKELGLNVKQELRSEIVVNSFSDLFNKLKMKLLIIALFSIVLFLMVFGDLDKFKNKFSLKYTAFCMSFPLIIFSLLFWKNLDNGSSLMSLFELNKIRKTDLPVDNFITVSLSSFGVDLSDRTMLINDYSNCFFVNSRFVDESLFDFDGGIACVKELSFSKEYPQECLVVNSNQDYIEYSAFKGIVFNRINVFVPDYNSMACSINFK